MDNLLHIKAYIVEEKNAIDEVNHKIQFVIPEKVDRDDEVVTAQAMFDAINDKTTFTANPICLPCHQHRLDSGNPPCVGNWEPETAKLLKNSVTIFLAFAHDTSIGGEYWKCYSKRHMRAISIGFQPKESSVETRAGKQVRVITKIELYEISCVAVGCNAGALSTIKSLFGWDEKDGVPQNAKEYLDGKFEEIKKLVVEQMDVIKELILPDQDGLAKALLGQDFEPSVPAEKISAEQIVKILKTVIERS